MRNLLFVRGSIFGEDGRSSQLAEAFLSRYRAVHPDVKVVVRDVQQPAIAHLDAATFRAFGKPHDALTDADRALLALSDALIGELRDATELLIAMPLYNFGIPSAFKAWIDHVARTGHTFRYTPAGPQGLLGNIRRCWVLAARGGAYQGTPLDTQTPYLTTMLGFMGIPAPEFVYAEGLARVATRDATLEAALQRVAQIDI